MTCGLIYRLRNRTFEDTENICTISLQNQTSNTLHLKTCQSNSYNSLRMFLVQKIPDLGINTIFKAEKEIYFELLYSFHLLVIYLKKWFYK